MQTMGVAWYNRGVLMSALLWWLHFFAFAPQTTVCGKTTPTVCETSKGHLLQSHVAKQQSCQTASVDVLVRLNCTSWRGRVLSNQAVKLPNWWPKLLLLQKLTSNIEQPRCSLAACRPYRPARITFHVDACDLLMFVGPIQTIEKNTECMHIHV